MVTEAEMRRELQKAAKKLEEAHKTARSANAQLAALAKILRQKGILDEADLRVISASARA